MISGELRDGLAIAGAISTVGAFLVALLRLWLSRKRPWWYNALRMARRVKVQVQQSGWKPDVILGLGRSGALWGGWLAGNLGTKPIFVIDLQYLNKDEYVTFENIKEDLSALQKRYGENANILVVEGAASTGQTLRKFKDLCKELGFEFCIEFAVLYTSVVAERPEWISIKFVGRRALEPWPKSFPWHEDQGWLRFLRSDNHGMPSQ